jgi:Flp pilus assembly protein TadB
MSRERARRRAEREAVRAAAEAARVRRAERRSRRRALLRRVTPRVPDRRRAWLLPRRSPGQRAFVVGLGLGLIALVWYLVDAWPMRIGFTLLALLLLPVLVVLTFDRRV